MKYRKLDANGDYSFGRSNLNFLVDSPQAVAQAILTSLRLFEGEWFLDTTAGIPWLTQVVGFNTQAGYDDLLKSKIQDVTGVTGIVSYQSSLDDSQRFLQVQVVVDTEFGTVSIAETVVVQSGYGVGGYGRQPYGE